MKEYGLMLLNTKKGGSFKSLLRLTVRYAGTLVTWIKC